MSRDINNIIKDIQKRTEEIYEKSSKAHDEEIKQIKCILVRMDAKLNDLVSKINELNVLLYEVDAMENEDQEENEDWESYDYDDDANNSFDEDDL